LSDALEGFTRVFHPEKCFSFFIEDSAFPQNRHVPCKNGEANHPFSRGERHALGHERKCQFKECCGQFLLALV